jgi:hypothetical protein
VTASPLPARPRERGDPSLERCRESAHTIHCSKRDRKRTDDDRHHRARPDRFRAPRIRWRPRPLDDRDSADRPDRARNRPNRRHRRNRYRCVRAGRAARYTDKDSQLAADRTVASSATWATPSSLPSSTHHSSLSTRRLRQQPLSHRRRVTVGASSVTPQRLDVPVGSFFALVEFTTGERTRIHSLLRFCAV